MQAAAPISSLAPAKRAIRLIVIHCLDVPNGRHTTVEDVDRWHRERGFSGIGYHHVIYLDGSVHDGRPHATVGAHAKGWNADSLGIALVGRNQFTQEQWKALFKLIWRVADAYQIPVQTPRFDAGHVAGIAGHGELPGVTKTCPGFSVRAWLAAGMQPTPEQVLPWVNPSADWGC